MERNFLTLPCQFKPPKAKGPKTNKKLRGKKTKNPDSEPDLNNMTSTLATSLLSCDKFNQWLLDSESQLDDDVINFRILDLQAIIDKRKVLEELYDQMETNEPKILEISEGFQRFCQMIPPSKERDEKKIMIRDTRSRMMKLRLKVVEQREIFRVIVPLLCHYNDHSMKLKPWLEEAELKSQTFIHEHNNDTVLLEHSEVIEALLQELLEQKPVYEAYLTYGEFALDISLTSFENLKSDIEQTIERWDDLCTKLEKCLNGLGIAKKREEHGQKNEAERIDRQIRKESHKCNCNTKFEINRVSEGKYTFGSSKIVRLVRIHGSSVVVRVGGGWEFLLEFLIRCDPCRGKEYLEDGVDALKKLGLRQIDERRHSYAFESRKVFIRNQRSSSGINNECEVGHDSETNSLSSSIDSLDGASLGSDAGHTCNVKPLKIQKSPTRNRSMARKLSDSRISSVPAKLKDSEAIVLRPKSATPAGRSVRKSLVERQGDFSERMKLESCQRKLVISSNFV